VVVGVLIDTFLVRTLLVPTLAVDLGDRVWWPGRPAHRLPERQPTRRAGSLIGRSSQMPQSGGDLIRGPSSNPAASVDRC
jgi:MMPL family